MRPETPEAPGFWLHFELTVGSFDLTLCFPTTFLDTGGVGRIIVRTAGPQQGSLFQNISARYSIEDKKKHGIQGRKGASHPPSNIRVTLGNWFFRYNSGDPTSISYELHFWRQFTTKWRLVFIQWHVQRNDYTIWSPKCPIGKKSGFPDQNSDKYNLVRLVFFRTSFLQEILNIPKSRSFEYVRVRCSLFGSFWNCCV